MAPDINIYTFKLGLDNLTRLCQILVQISKLFCIKMCKIYHVKKY